MRLPELRRARSRTRPHRPRLRLNRHPRLRFPPSPPRAPLSLCCLLPETRPCSGRRALMARAASLALLLLSSLLLSTPSPARASHPSTFALQRKQQHQRRHRDFASHLTLVPDDPLAALDLRSTSYPCTETADCTAARSPVPPNAHRKCNKARSTCTYGALLFPLSATEECALTGRPASSPSHLGLSPVFSCRLVSRLQHGLRAQWHCLCPLSDNDDDNDRDDHDHDHDHR